MALYPPAFRGCTPELRSIDFTDVSGSSLLQFGNLTYIALRSLRRLSLSVFLGLLERCPMLQRLEIYYVQFGTSGVPSQTVVPLPALANLFVEGTDAHHILPHISAPNLMELEIWLQETETLPFTPLSNWDSRRIIQQVKSLYIANQGNLKCIDIIGLDGPQSIRLELPARDHVLPMQLHFLALATLPNLWGEATARGMATIPVLEFPGIYSDYLCT
jgi:hypothetical protein